MVSVHVSARFKDNALARLVVELFPAHDALDHVLQGVRHTPQPVIALLELGLVRLATPPPTLERGTVARQ